jgi:hypothetical protein
MAGVISAPGSKYGHWTSHELPVTPDAWRGGAEISSRFSVAALGRMGDAIRSRPRFSAFA